ncbi:MAG: DUF167 family protein [Bdellovibrionota bacterium]
MKITVQIKPNSRKESVEKNSDGSYTVRVNAPPVEGKANTRLLEALAEHFGVPKSRVEARVGSQVQEKSGRDFLEMFFDKGDGVLYAVFGGDLSLDLLGIVSTSAEPAISIAFAKRSAVSFF